MTIDWCRTAAATLTNVADAVNFAPLKGAAGLATQILTVIQVRTAITRPLCCGLTDAIQAVRDNQADALQLGRQIFDYTSAVVRAYDASAEAEHDGTLHENVKLFIEYALS